MRINLSIDSATNEELRALAAARSITLREHRETGGEVPAYTATGLVNVGCDGPECWHAETGPMPSGTETALMANYSDQLRTRSAITRHVGAAR